MERRSVFRHASTEEEAMSARKSMTALLLAATTLLMSAGPASATPPGENGRIAVRRYLNPAQTWGAIFTIRPNGTGLRRVTRPPRGILHWEPDWSADGRWITYTRFWHGRRLRSGHPPQILKIHPNGTGRTNLSATCLPDVCVGDYESSWSPDGRRLAFIRRFGPVSSATGGLFVMRADGTHAHQLSHPGSRQEDLSPMWSPGGHRIVFVRFDEKRDKDALFTIYANGRREQRITPWRVSCAFNPDWSPNGRWIIATCHPGEQNDLWLVHPNGTELHRLTHSAGTDVMWFSSSFSPDGTKIVTSRLPGVGTAGNADVYVMNRDGSGLQNITQSPLWDSAPDWGPRG
jgi:TolB protein